MWGAATSSYQIEGDNVNSDWWEWEQQGKTKDLSGQACDYWNRYESDHALLCELGVGVFRLSLEWSRIEPKEGEFSSEAIEHYRQILADLKSRDIKVMLTLWHWTSPIWFQEKYGWHKKAAVGIFSRYAQKIVDELGDLIDVYVVLNEPMVPLGMGFLTGEFPPGSKNPWKFWRALNNMATAYRETYRIIHSRYANAQVGISYLYNWYEVDGLGPIEKIANRISRWYRIDLFGNRIKDLQDYVGVDYYRLGKIVFDPKNHSYLGFRIEEDPSNPLRWVTYAKGMRLVLEEAYRKFEKPIYIIENGTPTDSGIEDDGRIDFIKIHLAEVAKAIESGIPIAGYNYWSLLDNYEWLSAYVPRFGLVEMDYETMERHPRKSFYEYAKICKNNEVEIEMVDEKI